MDNLFFVSGLPRSGSTLLMNLLGQNPNNVVTPTSGLPQMFLRSRNTWRDSPEFIAEGLDVVKPRVQDSLGGMLTGFFKKDLEAGKACFNKSRAWLNFIEDLEICLDRKVKVIVTLRDIRDILASFEKKYRKRGIDFSYGIDQEFFDNQTVVGRANNYLKERNDVGLTVSRIRDSLLRGVRDRLIIVPYLSLTNNPKGVLNAIHEQLDLEPFDYDPKNVEQLTKEDDTVYGMDLHTIEGEVRPGETRTWEGILPERFAAHVADQYHDIHKLLEPKTYSSDTSVEPA